MLLAIGCQANSQPVGETFQIIKPVSTVAQHGKDVVKLTLPKGCVITVLAEKERSRIYASIK